MLYINRKKSRLLLSFVILLFCSLQSRLYAQTFSTKSASTFPTPSAPARASIADFDNDGDADILYQTAGNGTAFRFARSNGDGTFTDQAISASPFAGVTLVDNNGSNYHVADFDRDGDMDLWAGVNNTTGSYYRNDNGTFSLQSSASFPAPAASGRATAGDFDKDGDADFLYQTGGNGSVFKYARSNGNGTFTDVPLASSPFAGLSLPDNTTFNYQVADFDGDGDVDLWVGANGGSGSYFKNNNGVFAAQSSATFPTPTVVSRAVICDFDTDGDADILYQTGGNGSPFQYARNNGDATFTILTQAASPFASVTLIDNSGYSYYIGDFDHDGDLDVWAAKVSTSASGAFYSKDSAPPNLASFTPTNNSTNVSRTVNITYTFDQPVIKGNGNISLVKISDNTIAEAISVTSSQVTGSGTSWTIDPSITLEPSTQYAVKSDAGTFKTSGGTIFAGVSLSNVQSFRTQSALSSVSVPANGTYKIGDNLTFTVTYSENMVVDVTGGTPFIPVTIGSTVRNAVYVSGTGSAALTFTYTVASGDADNDGIVVGSAISLNGGTIKDAATSTNAPLTLNDVGVTTGVLVDGIAPSVNSITRASADNTHATSVDYTVTFSENVSGVDISDFTLTKTGTADGSVASVSASSGTTITVTVNGVTGNGTLRLDLKSTGTGIVDNAGNAITGGYTSGEVYTIVQLSNNTDYFRSITSGNWNSTSSWESSTDNITYHAASLTPDFNANQITIQSGHTVTITANVAIDQTTVNAGGSIVVNSGVTLTINDGAGWDIVVNGNVTVNNGGSMIVQSTSTGTASIGNSTGTISGNVTVERFIPARRAWRLLTAPLSNANTIRQAWQNGGTYTAGIGTFITGPAGVNGLDNGNTYSLKTFDIASQLLVPVTNSNISLSSASGSADNKGYFLFVRGDRNPANLTPPNTNITTLSSVGTVQMGTQTFTASAIANNFSLIGNPYASPVDFSLLTRNNLAKRFYAWDPSLNTVGGYVVVDDADNDGTYSVTPPSTQTSVLQSSQAFFVQTVSTGSASLVFDEASKSTTSTAAGFRTGNGSNEVLRTSLYLRDGNSLSTLADGVLSEFNNNYSAAVNIQDGAKMTNINENLAIERQGQLLALERRPLVNETDTLFLNLTNTSSRNYSFRFEPSNISAVVSASLQDSYLNTSTPISLSEPTTLDFSVVANTASADANRFGIVFKTSGVLPISTINLKAAEQNGGITVDWSIATETNMQQYQVEKSSDGQTFGKVATATATGNNNASATYNWFDAAPLSGNNFYRIKAVSKAGEIKYSAVVNVRTGAGKASIVVYPNPVENKTINLQMSNEPKGRYFVELFNSLGQRMLTKTIEHIGGSATQTIPLSSLVSKGVYQLHVTNGDIKINQQVIVP